MSDDSGECSGDEMDLRPSGSEYRERNLSKRRIVMTIDFSTDSDSSENCHNNNYNNNKSICNVGEENTCQQQEKTLTGNSRYIKGKDASRGRLNKLNIVTSDDSSSSDNEIILRPRIRRKPNHQKKSIFDNESDVEKPNCSSLTSVLSATQSDMDGGASDSSSNELLEKCPICLLTFRDQNIGSPSTCQHIFCANCIESWSKNMQTCPIDRLLFDHIIVRVSYKNRKVLREINVVPSQSNVKGQVLNDDLLTQEEGEMEEDVTNCELCHMCDREDVMLLCDRCNRGYHMDCLTPPLTEIPFGSWYCVNCNDSQSESAGEADVAAELSLIIDQMRDAGISENQLQIRRINHPRILRTRQHERIRAVVLRQTRRQKQMNDESQNNGPSRRRYRRRRRRRRITKRRTYVVEYDVNNFNEKFAIKTTKKVIKRRKKVRTIKMSQKSSQLTVKNRPRLSASKRLAEQLGVKKDSTFSSRFSSAGTSLSLFGGSYDLEYFSDECDNDNDNGSIANEVGINAGQTMGVQTAVRIANYDPCRLRKGGYCSKRSSILPQISNRTVDTNFDILSDIINMQDRWNNAMRNINLIHINPDGSLLLPNPSTNNGAKTTTTTCNNEITRDVGTNEPNINRMPLYSQGGGGTNSFGGYQNNYNQNYRRSGGGGGASGGNNHNTNQQRYSTGSSSGTVTGSSNNNMGFNMLDPNANYNTNLGNNTQFSMTNLNRNTFAPFPLRFNQRNKQPANQRQQHNINANNINNSNINNFPNKQRNPSQFINNNRLNNNRLNNNRLNNNRLNNNRFINISMHNSTSSLLPRRSSNLSTYQDPLQMHQTGSLSMETNTLFGGLPPPICSQQPPATSMPCVDNTTTPPVPQLPTMANKLIDSHGLSMGINMGVGGGVGVGTISSNNSLFSGLPPPIRGQTPLTSSIVPTLHNVTLPTPLIMNVPPPPMPPAAVHLNFGNNICNSSNNSLFQLNTNYSNDNDNDSNCPNFSVYSQESQEVAKSTELNQQQQPMATTLHNATNATSIVKEDDDNEDLVQLGDDDDDDDINNNNDIPMPPEPKPTNYEKNKVATKPPECELYEPENPTDELDEDDDNNNGDINDSTNENLKNVDMQENNKESLNEIILLASNDNDEDRQYIAIEKDVNYNKEAKEETEIKTINKSDLSKDLTSNKITIAYRRKESNSPTDEIHKEVNKSKDIDIEKVKDLKSSTSSPSKMATILSQTSDKDLRTTSKGVLDLYDDTYWDEFQIERPKEFTPIDSAASKCTSKKSDDDANHPENIKNDNDDKKSEPDRSYTPCLDENNDLDESVSNQIVNVEESLQSKQNVEEPSNTPPKICNKIKQSKTTNEKRSLDNMETELVSEDEYDNDPLESDKFNIKNTSKREKPAKDSIETFKKVSGKQRERNYRGDKQQQSNKRSRRRRRSSRSRGKSLSYSRSRSRSRFRSRTRSRSARAERSRNARSRSLHKRKAKGRSRSRSITNKENRSRFRRDVNRRENYRDVALRSIDQAHKRSKRRALPRYDVRNVVNSAQRSTKDRYGRDTSRQGKSSRSVSRERRHRFSHSRSRSRRRSFSPPPERRNRRLSISLSPSPHPFLRNESITPARRYSPITKRWNSPVNSRRSPFCRRTQTPIRLMRSRSTSSKDSGIGRHKISKHHQEKSPIFSLSRKNIRQKHSPIISPHYTPQISRSPTKSPLIKIKRKKSKDFKKKKTTKRALSSLSPSPHRRLMRQTDTFVEIEKPLRKKDRHHSHSPKMQVTKKHGVIDDEWSPSPSPVPPELSTAYIYPQENNISWTPPMDLPHHNLHEPDTVLFHTDNISRPISACCSPKDKGKRIKKKKKGEKRRGDIRKEKKRKRRTETPDTVPSKEVFASGNNILVSVSFNKDAASSQPQQMPQQQTIVTVPPNREDLLPNRRISIDRLTNSSINNKKRKEKHKKLDAKPIAIIDLERSPFQIQQEPFDVIVLTDSEDNLNDLQREDHQERCRSESCSKETNEPTQHDKSLEHLNTMLEEESYDIPPSQMGPKTPPEPRLVKFNLQSKKQNKVRNPLHDEEDDDDINVSISIEDHRQPQQTQQQQDQHRTDMEMAHVSNSQKIGPNTPPETGPYSPDAYDPFEPTKSPSVSPRFPTPPPQSTLTDVCTSQLSDNNKLIDMSTPQKHVSVIDDTHRDQIPALGGNNNATQGTSSLNPVDLVMALMNTKATANSNQDLVNKSNDSQFSISSSINQHDDNMHDKSDDNNTLTVLSNVLISTSSGQHIPSISSPTPPTISKKNIPMPKLGGSVGGSSSSGANIRNGMAPNTEDSLNLNDIESPYSPGSADYEDLFEPPPDNSGNSRRRNSKRNSCNNSGGGAIAVGKPDVFDNLFGSSSPIGVHTRMSSYTPSKRHNKITNSLRKSKIKVGRSTDDLIKVYDDVPNSAVELQVKDRFLRKLNRQERVVEEVKLVLKPRFNKKQITKEDYKEIMRRAVPKICHSKSGEIDPHKIKNLIEAYVKKFRAKHKKLNLSNTGQVSSAVKCAAYLKKL